MSFRLYPVYKGKSGECISREFVFEPQPSGPDLGYRSSQLYRPEEESGPESVIHIKPEDLRRE